MVEVRDRGLQALASELRTLNLSTVRLGVTGPVADEIHPVAKVPNGVLAKWLHFGTDTMPARPFVDQGVSLIRTEARTAWRKAARDIARGAKVVDALRPLAKLGASAVQDAVDDANSWVSWQLSERTINRKGHDRHLIDTGTIRDAIGYGIVHGGKVLENGLANGS